MVGSNVLTAYAIYLADRGLRRGQSGNDRRGL